MNSDDGYRSLLECGIGPVVDMAVKCESIFATHTHALVSVSGGADSDVMMDMAERVRQVAPIEITYVWFNTGIEYAATKRHLRDLEAKYGVTIERVRAEKTVPVSCNEFGQPFISKHVSEMCERLQSIGFQWEDEPFEVLDKRYPRCRSALNWWCNGYEKNGVPQGRFNIMRNRWLKEFMVAYPPQFRISAKCCEYAKKRPSRQIELAGGGRRDSHWREDCRGWREGVAQDLLRQGRAWLRHLPTAVLVDEPRPRHVLRTIQRDPLRLLQGVGTQENRMRWLPLRARAYSRAGRDRALRAEHGEGVPQGIRRCIRLHRKVSGICTSYDARTFRTDATLWR